MSIVNSGDEDSGYYNPFRDFLSSLMPFSGDVNDKGSASNLLSRAGETIGDVVDKAGDLPQNTISEGSTSILEFIYEMTFMVHNLTMQITDVIKYMVEGFVVFGQIVLTDIINLIEILMLFMMMYAVLREDVLFKVLDIMDHAMSNMFKVLGVAIGSGSGLLGRGVGAIGDVGKTGAQGAAQVSTAGLQAAGSVAGKGLEAVGAGVGKGIDAAGGAVGRVADYAVRDRELDAEGEIERGKRAGEEMRENREDKRDERRDKLERQKAKADYYVRDKELDVRENLGKESAKVRIQDAESRRLGGSVGDTKPRKDVSSVLNAAGLTVNSKDIHNDDIAFMNILAEDKGSLIGSRNYRSIIRSLARRFNGRMNPDNLGDMLNYIIESAKRQGKLTNEDKQKLKDINEGKTEPTKFVDDILDDSSLAGDF